MAKIKIFISSVQSEFAVERQQLHDYILADPLLGKFFDPFLFELLPAIDLSAQSVYLDEVLQSKIYLGLFGTQYGFEDKDGISPTEREFDHASLHHKTRLVFLSAHNSTNRHPKQLALIEKAQNLVVRKKFATIDELKSSVYASLVHFLIEKEYIRTGPFDTTIQSNASLTDIDEAKVRKFVTIARAKRGFKLHDTDSIESILSHLNLMQDGKLTNASILLFGKEPQRFFINSEIRCVHFHGTVVEKTIPSYKVFKGDVFELVDQAVDFVLSKVDYAIGTRAQSVDINGKYEIPKEIVTEAIVNAVAHRDYTSNGSIQVMLFRDRLEIINPGSLPMGWTTSKLKLLHTSVPANPLLAEPMYLAEYIERLGTGTADMVRIARENGLNEPDFIQEDEFKTIIYRKSYGQVADKLRASSVQVLEIGTEIKNIIRAMYDEVSLQTIQDNLGIKRRDTFRENYLKPSINQGYINMKYPDVPNHPDQKYVLTEAGVLLRNALIDDTTVVDDLTPMSEARRNDVGTMSERCRNELGDTAAHIFEEIAANSKITTEELAHKIGKSTRTVERNIEKLKNSQYITRQGPNLGGYWEVQVNSE